ncbi:MAG: glycosyltransferase family 4 protein [Pseudomonadota bacterium]
MRVLTVSPFYEAHGGGIEIVAGALSRAIAETGRDSAWAAAAIDEAPDAPAVTMTPIAAIDPLEKLIGLPMPLPGPGGVQRLWNAVRNSDGVVVHDALYVSSILAALAAKLSRKPYVLVQHIGAIPFSNPVMRGVLALANRVVTRSMMKAATQVVFISDTVRAQFEDAKLAPPPALLFNGVNADRFYPGDASERAATRRAWGVAPDEQAILFVGRFVEKKGLSVLREIARATPEKRFLLAGAGPIDPSTWGLANVHTLGKLSPDAIARAYRAADALLLPSVGEGFPLVVQEAMASGLRVFCGAETANADPGARRFLSGCAVDLADPSASAERFVKAISRADLGPSSAAADYAATTYSWPVFADAITRYLSVDSDDGADKKSGADDGRETGLNAAA